MRHLQPLAARIDVSDIVRELDEHPELWNQHTLRTEGYAPVHNAVSDIWIRYRDIEELTGLRNFCPPVEAVERFVGDPHESVWYPGIESLPTLHAFIFDLMHTFDVERLGGVLITRIPPGGEVKPHIDRGWHAGYYEKVALQLKSARGQAFCFADGRFDCPPGTLYAFDNSFQHWVENPTEHERITCIICVRRDQRKRPLHSGTGE